MWTPERSKRTPLSKVLTESCRTGVGWIVVAFATVVLVNSTASDTAMAASAPAASCKALIASIRRETPKKSARTDRPSSARQQEYQNLFEEFTQNWDRYVWTKTKFEIQDGKALIDEKSHPAEKKLVARALGFELTSEGRLSSPGFVKLVSGYLDFLDQKKVPPRQRVLPAVLLIKGTYGKPGFEYRWITPLLEPWPTEAGFRFYDYHKTGAKDRDAFNVPSEIVLAGLAQGKFPLLSPAHDGAHFMSFALHTDYMTAVKRQIDRLKDDRGSSYEVRADFILEMLALADPRSADRLVEVLKTPEVQSRPHWLSRQTFARPFQDMGDGELVAHARKLIEIYDSSMVDYGAAPFRSWEKEFFFGDPLGKTGELGRRDPDGIIRHLMDPPIYSDTRTHARTGSFSFAAVPRYNLLRLLDGLDRLDSLPYRWTQTVLRAIGLRTNLLAKHYYVGSEKIALDRSPKETRAMIVELLREELGRTEYILWNTSQTSPVEWVDALMGPKLMSLDSRPVMVMRDFFGADSFAYRAMVEETRQNQAVPAAQSPAKTFDRILEHANP